MNETSVVKASSGGTGAVVYIEKMQLVDCHDHLWLTKM